ncbi:MAG: germination protein Ger(x)C family [Pelosinus sp.]|jgi:spore germination protein KC|nr:germination protein Ger(x)C family [Pelosinus sp.]
MKKAIAFCIIPMMMLLSAGCVSKNEIENSAIIVAFGVDTTADGKYMVSTQILKTSKQSSGSGDGSSKGEKQQSDVISLASTGSTLSDALDHLSKQLGKKLVLSHIKFIVISEDVAKSGVAGLIDFTAREYQMRANIVILVTNGKASEIIKTTTPIDPVPANAIDSILNLQARYGYIPVITSLDFFNLLGSKTAAPMAGVIRLYEDEQQGKVFKLTDIAIFKKDKFIGYMTDEEAVRGVQWIRNKVKAGNIVIPLSGKDQVTIQLISANSTIKPIMKENKPAIKLTVQNKGNILDMTGDFDPMKNPEILTEFEQMENEIIKQEIEKALSMAQTTFQADIFDFGEAIHRDYPKEWVELEKNWSEVFPELEVEVEVHSNIKRTGVISKPVY